MTNKDYILSRLRSFNIEEAQLADMEIDLYDEYKPKSIDVGIAMCSLIEDLVLAPKVRSINEQGFSMSWDFESLSKYYLYLCRKYGITPNEDVVGMGMSQIIDKTDCW